MENDERFKHIGKDPRFRRIPKAQQKVKIDKRFQAMFDDKRFKLKYTVDKRGRPANFTTSDNLRKFYDLESGSEDSGEEEQSENSQEEQEHPKEAKSKSVKKATAENSVKATPKSLDKANKEKRTSVAGKWTVSEASETAVQEKTTKKGNKTAQDTKKPLKSATAVKKSHIAEDVDESDEDDEEAEEEESEDSETDDESKPAQTISEKLQDLQVDYARGDGRLVSESSSDEETSSEDGEEEEDVDHHWGELDRDAERTDESTARIAVCHMDWDRIKAVDLFVLFQSFAPPGGTIKSVHIYPSEFGLKRMQEEEVHGPPELTKTSLDDDADEQEQDESLHMERLRQYQLSRLKYYYAVVICNSVETASRIYDECDRMEFESSAARLDLRFIPDDMTFDHEAKDACTSMPDPTQYKPRYFMTSALQQAAVELTWDETDPDRKAALEKLFTAPKNGKGTADAMKEDDLKAFLATSSSEDEDDESQEDEVAGTDDGVAPGDEKSQIEKYRSLLANLGEQDPKKKKKSDVDMEMEITWGVGLKEKAEEIVQRKLAGVNKLTPWEERLQKRKEKHRLKKLQKKEQQKGSADEEDDEEADDEEEDIPSDIDLNDPYFKEELENPEFKPKKKIGTASKSGQNRTSKRKEDPSEEEDDEKKRAEMELLLMDDEDGNKKHFSLKKLVDTDKKGKKKKSKDNKASTGTADNFEVEVKDPRFAALFTSHHYNVDPSDPHFKKTKGMDKIITEKQKRRAEEPIDEPASKNPKTQTELDRLVNSIKTGVKMRKKK